MGRSRAVLSILTATLMAWTPAWSESPAPFPEFSAKRVKVPTASAGKRITVQIDPNAVRVKPKPKAEPEPEAPATAEASALPYDWYWAAVSPALGAGGAARLFDAEDGLTKNPAGATVKAPRLQALQDIARRHGRTILEATVGTRVSPALVLAVIGIESSGRIDAVSSAGATGLMQLMPATAERFGVTDRTDAEQNIRGGIAYLDWLMGEFGNDPVMVLAAYNAGENAVKNHVGVPPYAETRAYVPKVMAAWGVAKGLCLTPPQLMSDGCVFNVQSVASNG